MPYIVKDSLLSFILSVIGIFLLGSVPFMFMGMSFNTEGYLTGIEELFKSMMNPAEIVYYTKSGVYPLFPGIWDIVGYSLTILFSAFFIALFLALLFSIVIFLFPSQLKDKIRVFSFMFESIPDVLIAIGIQFFIIWFFKKTNILLFQIVSLFDQKTYFVPIFCLTVLPTLLILKVLLINMEEEFNKQYIDTAKGKGIGRLRILWRHVLPNTLLSVFHQSRNILWFMLSNLLMVEYLFNIYGVTTLVREMGSPAIFTISILLLFLPMFLFFTALRILTYKWVGEK
ncbi:ABC transporter permease subunit [Fictibacillus phosphorivorans]|uniref:ABC transporter permease subunit n=1 Tax=Fictibacillus phosphorivorans TaxID=1221500 RepID=UPI0020404B9C|nr:ABC transporter permease subunit [Fictibacillus phosphorivorans]MCM3719424.1 ABC transporter permease subunit [Fictibacillus phosphorivorans]MCM3777098.1 ABC transporter permease subunit [Fictibacillus phosphorivorans]